MTDDKLTAFLAISRDKLGPWMSAALEDPQVCDEMKRDIREWFDAIEGHRGPRRYEVFFRRDVEQVIVIEADSEEHATDLVLDGQYDKLAAKEKAQNHIEIVNVRRVYS